MNKMAAPTGQHGKYLFWLQLLNWLSDFHTVFTDDLRKRCSFFPDQGDWCHSSPLKGSRVVGTSNIFVGRDSYLLRHVLLYFDILYIKLKLNIRAI